MDFIGPVSQAEFLTDRKTRAACMMMLIVIGESAARIAEESPAFVADHADWPWLEMRGMRNRAAHAYGSIVFEVVWDTLTKHIPPLLRRLEALGVSPMSYSAS